MVESPKIDSMQWPTLEELEPGTTVQVDNEFPGFVKGSIVKVQKDKDGLFIKGESEKRYLVLSEGETHFVGLHKIDQTN